MRRRRGGEVNLTPLLDVLFSILFIVLLTGAQSEKLNADAAQEEADGLRQEIAGLESELDALRGQLDSLEAFREDARVLTLQNFAEGADHRLRVSLGTDPRELDTVLMGVNRLENVADRVRALVEEVIEGAAGAPVYISFRCDKGAIYRREYETVIRVLEDLQREYKEVFLRVIENN